MHYLYIWIELGLLLFSYFVFFKLLWRTFFPFCLTGEDGNRESGESEMDVQGEKTRHNTVGPDDWDGPSKTSPT